MAKQISSNNTGLRKPKKNRKGIHAKSKSGRSKNSKSYTKRYVGQGR